MLGVCTFKKKWPSYFFALVLFFLKVMGARRLQNSIKHLKKHGPVPAVFCSGWPNLKSKNNNNKQNTKKTWCGCSWPVCDKFWTVFTFYGRKGFINTSGYVWRLTFAAFITSERMGWEGFIPSSGNLPRFEAPKLIRKEFAVFSLAFARPRTCP